MTVSTPRHVFPLAARAPRLASFLAAGACLAGCLLPVSPARPEVTVRRPVAEGVVLRQTVREPPEPPLVVTALEVDLQRPGVAVSAGLGQDDVENDGAAGGREAVTAFARRKRVTAAVNADFFAGGAPIGLCIRAGELISLPYPNRSVLAVLPGNRVAFDFPKAAATVKARPGAPKEAVFSLTGLNRRRGTGALVLYTPTYGPRALTNPQGVEVVLANAPLPLRPGRTDGVVREVRAGRGGAPLAPGELVLSGHGPAAAFLQSLQPGDPVTIEIRITSARVADWRAVREAIGGGPMLARDGRVAVDAAAQGFRPDVTRGKAPRTAVGVTRDGRLVLAAVDGRQPLSAGATLEEMAALMIRLGCETAMNLDGGGSTAMAVHSLRVTSPSDGSERPVAQFLAVSAPEMPGDPGAPRPFGILAETDGPVGSGQKLPLELRDENGEPVPFEAAVVWGVEGSIGFVDQTGLFTARKAGAGRIVARWGKMEASLAMQVIPGTTPAALEVTWRRPEPDRPSAARLVVTVRDADGNAIPGIVVEVTLPLSAGSVDAGSRPTGEGGTATFDVAWREGAPRQVTVKSGAVTRTTTGPTPPADAVPPATPNPPTTPSNP